MKQHAPLQVRRQRRPRVDHAQQPGKIRPRDLAPAEKQGHLAGVDRAHQPDLGIAGSQGNRRVDLREAIDREPALVRKGHVARTQDDGEPEVCPRERIPRLKRDNMPQFLDRPQRGFGGTALRLLD